VRLIGIRPRFLLAAALLAAAGAFGQEPQYRLVTDPAESAQPVALEILKHLAAGELEAAAALSNAPERRLEVLRQFRASVGEEQFRQLFGRYFAPQNRIVMEAAIGARRLLVWDLGEASHQLAGQYFVEVEGRFVMDDVPNAEREKLQRVLAAERKKSGSGPDFKSSK
jgi:hypothetical protein